MIFLVKIPLLTYHVFIGINFTDYQIKSICNAHFNVSIPKIGSSFFVAKMFLVIDWSWQMKAKPDWKNELVRKWLEIINQIELKI